MKTSNELFIAFTSNRKPTIKHPETYVHPNAMEFSISEKQLSWLCRLVYNENPNKDFLLTQYSVDINGMTYMVIGKKNKRIRVTFIKLF